MHRAHHIACIGHGGFRHGPGNAKIRHLGAAIRHHQDIMWFDITMHQIIGMSMSQSTGNILGYPQCVLYT